jgi:hypothetical protein
MTVSPGVSIKDFEDAVYAWITSATGLAAIWTDQAAPRPDNPYCGLSILNGPTPVSPLWELRHTYDGGRPLEEEIVYNACVPCTFTISCQAYVPVPISRDSTQHAFSVLSSAQAALALPSFLSTFASSEISVIDKGAIQNISAVIKDAQMSRASMDVIFGASLNAVEYAGYIDKVEIESTAFNWSFIVDAS